MFRTRALAVAALATAGLALSACGSDTLSTGGNAGSKTSEAVPSATANADLVAKVPAKIKVQGHHHHRHRRRPTPPNEFLDARRQDRRRLGRRPVQRGRPELGLKTEWVPANVRLDHPRRPVAASTTSASRASPSTTSARRQVNMVSYFNAGTQWATAEGQPQEGRPDDAVRQEVAVQKGTVQADEDLPPSARGVHRPPASRHRRAAVQPARTRPPRPSPPARPTPCSPTPRRRLRREADQRHARAARRASTTRPPTATCVPKDQNRLRRGHRRGPQGAQGRRHLREDPDKWGVRGRRHRRLRRQPD